MGGGGGCPHLGNVISTSEELEARGEQENIRQHLYSPQNPRETGESLAGCDHTQPHLNPFNVDI